MDRRRRRARALALALTLAAAGTALAADSGPPLRAMLWARTDADAVRLFAVQPAECLKPDLSNHLIEVGRAAFGTPILLGGQAARAGLSCESCHRAGRGNPDFLFPGASGDPGTADVTLSLFSSHRGNGVHDPKPIPDLAAPKTSLKVDQARAGELEAFIRGLIVEEFDGPEPSRTVLVGLAEYVRALDPSACPAQAQTPVRLAVLLDDARRAVAMAAALEGLADRQTVVMMTAAARARLGLIDERYAGLHGERARIRAADRRLAELQTTIRAGRPAAGGLLQWIAESHRLETTLARREHRSLFNPARLSQAAKRRLPAQPS